MSTNVQRQDSTPPPPLDEGYWSALLREGEFSDVVQQLDEADSNHTSSTFIDSDTDIHTDYTFDLNGANTSDWESIQFISQNDEVIEMLVVGYNRGGLLVEWRGLRGFVPASQLINFPITAGAVIRRNALMSSIGHKLKLRVIELSSEQNRLILSERAARVEAGERAGILKRLQPGDTTTGHITNLCDFGAFVDLGGLEGLIHISELSWGRVGHPSDLLQRGQSVSVHVLDIDRDAGRIALSLKRLHPDPWETVGQRYCIGQTVVGTITNVVDFGAFACIEEGLEGLIHVSELAEGHFLHPRNVVQEGQTIEAKVLSIDSHARRLGLSLRLKQ